MGVICVILGLFGRFSHTSSHSLVWRMGNMSKAIMMENIFSRPLVMWSLSPSQSRRPLVGISKKVEAALVAAVGPSTRFQYRLRLHFFHGWSIFLGYLNDGKMDLLISIKGVSISLCALAIAYRIT